MVNISQQSDRITTIEDDFVTHGIAQYEELKNSSYDAQYTLNPTRRPAMPAKGQDRCNRQKVRESIQSAFASTAATLAREKLDSQLTTVFGHAKSTDGQALSFNWTVGATEGETDWIELDGMWEPPRAR